MRWLERIAPQLTTEQLKHLKQWEIGSRAKFIKTRRMQEMMRHNGNVVCYECRAIAIKLGFEK
jgi:hypothetical protein